MSYLVAYVNNEKFTPEVERYEHLDNTTFYPGDYYTLNPTHSETLRLAEFFELDTSSTYEFARVSVRKQTKGGFFGKREVDVYYFQYGGYRDVEFQSDLVYLEE